MQFCDECNSVAIVHLKLSVDDVKARDVYLCGQHLDEALTKINEMHPGGYWEEE